MPAPSLLFTTDQNRSQPSKSQSCAPYAIPPYTWQAQRNYHHASIKSGPEWSNQSLNDTVVRSALHKWAHLCVTSHPSQHNARHRVSGSAVAINVIPDVITRICSEIQSNLPNTYWSFDCFVWFGCEKSMLKQNWSLDRSFD